MKINFEFKCEDCGNNEIEEILEEVVVRTIIDSFHKFDDGSIDLNHTTRTSHEEGDCAGYCCTHCRTLLTDQFGTIVTPDDLFNFLSSKNMISKHELKSE